MTSTSSSRSLAAGDRAAIIGARSVRRRRRGSPRGGFPPTDARAPPTRRFPGSLRIMAGYVQADRPLTITTPLGPDRLFLVGLRGSEALSQLFHFQFDLIAEH